MTPREMLTEAMALLASAEPAAGCSNREATAWAARRRPALQEEYRSLLAVEAEVRLAEKAAAQARAALLTDLPEGAVSWCAGVSYNYGDARPSPETASELDPDLTTVEDYYEAAWESAVDGVSTYVVFYDADGLELEQ